MSEKSSNFGTPLIFILGRLGLPDRLPFRSQKSIGFFTSENTFALCGLYANYQDAFCRRNNVLFLFA